jgi:glycosyltransferase involved in cell wall biosynthesis
MKKVLVISFSDLTHDGRVSRQIDFIKDKYIITVLCYKGVKNSGYKILPIEKTKFSLKHKLVSAIFLLLRSFEKAYSLLYQYKDALNKSSNENFDLIIANDVEALPLAFKLKRNAKILFDAHEYAPRHFEDKLMWRIFFQPLNVYLCKKYIPLVEAMTTVGKVLSEEYQKDFGVKAEIITNATWYKELSPTTLKAGKVRLVHQGGAIPSRKLELMIEMMRYLDQRFTLDLILMSPQLGSAKTINYINHLTKLAIGDPRIRILPPLKSNEIVPFINNYDIGVFLLPPVNFNYANTLPNKLFDFIQARLAIAIGPTPEMKEIVDRYQIGIVADDFTPQALALKLLALNETQINQFKNNTPIAALDLSAEKNKSKLNYIIENLISQ